MVKKTGKEYRGVPSALTTFLETSAEINAKFAASGSRPQKAAPAAVAKGRGAN
jgi:hypothetical protein